MDFESFVTEQGATLTRLAYLLTADHHGAQDLTQTVLAKMFERWGRLEHLENLPAYARKSMVNEHLSWRRRRWTRERPAPPDDAAFRRETYPSTSDGRLDEIDAMRTRLDCLAPRARTVVVLRYWCDMDDPSIAAAMNITPSAVRATASRALRELRDQVAERTSP